MLKIPFIAKNDLLKYFYLEFIETCFDKLEHSTELDNTSISDDLLQLFISNNLLIKSDFDITFKKENIQYCSIESIDGITYLLCSGHGDDEVHVYFILYYDGLNIRAYVPKSGNIFNVIEKRAYNEDDIDYNDMIYSLPNYILMKQEINNNFNFYNLGLKANKLEIFEFLSMVSDIYSDKEVSNLINDFLNKI